MDEYLKLDYSQMDRDYDACSKSLERVLSHNVSVIKVLDKIEELGCKIPDNFFKLEPCQGNVSGGFNLQSPPLIQDQNSRNEKIPSSTINDWIPSIVICTNKQLTYKTFENTVLHELIHAYDVCRVRRFSYNDCKQHACTEIRASALSGECNLIEEAMRGRFSLAGKMQIIFMIL
jgi:inner membrane protease ATP23